MSDEKKPKKDAAPAADPAKTAKAPSTTTSESTPGMQVQKHEKQKWTVERAHKAAKRFKTIAEWETGAPASFKAAEARGWIDQCCSHMARSPMKSSKTSQRKSA